MVSIEDLYLSYGILADAKANAGENVEAYKVIMNGTKSGSSQKRLASQFIVRFHRHFPELSEESLEAMFDLCEDDDFSVVKQALRDLPQLCKDSIEYSHRATMILLQLLPTVLPSQQSTISDSLMTVLKVHTKETVKYMFDLMASDDRDLCHQAINFLHSKLKLILSYDQSKEIEETIVVSCKKVIGEVCDEECLLLVKTLKMLPSMATLTGRLHLLDVISQRLHLDRQPHGIEELKQILTFIRETDSLLSKNVPSTVFVNYICLSILPLIVVQDSDENLMTGFLHVLAEMVIFYDDNSCEKCLKSIYSCINDIIQCPAMNDEQGVLPLPEIEVYSAEELIRVEYILFAFHHLCRSYPQFLVLSENLERLKNLRSRLQFVSRVALMSKKKMQSQSATDSMIKTIEEIRMNNIISIIKDFFHNPPSFKTDIVLSFKSAASSDETKSPVSGSEKRKLISSLPVETATENVSKKAKVSSCGKANVSSSGVGKNNLYSAANSNLKTDFKEQAPTRPFQQKLYRGASSCVNSRGHRGSRNLNPRWQHHFQIQSQGQSGHYQARPGNSTRGCFPQSNFVRGAYSNSVDPHWQNQRNRMTSAPVVLLDQSFGSKNSYGHLTRPVEEMVPSFFDFQGRPVAGGHEQQNWDINSCGQRRVVMRNGSGQSAVQNNVTW